MEAHHHSHAHEKKNWKAYFWEFLMLFFAVFAGFLAENFREHGIERAREKEYMHSMIEDLGQDTTNCHNVTRDNSAIIQGLDTLISYLSASSHDNNNINLIYAYCIKYRYNTPEVQFSERTMSQLKNNGGLRLVKKKAVSDELSVYDQGIRFCDRQRDQALHYYQVLDESELNIFDFAPIKPLWDSLSKTDVLSVPIETIVRYVDSKARLRSTDATLFSKYMNAIIYDQVAIATYNNDLVDQGNKAASLIRLIQKKYDLKNE
jgi:hypothetical protein